jgi:hypothetical protein
MAKLDLFYSVNEKKLFWITGYTDNSYNINVMISMLTNNKNHFIKIGNLKKNAQINTDMILKSSRYKNMRYFWVDKIEIENVPKEAFQISNDWTMDKWIEN